MNLFILGVDDVRVVLYEFKVPYHFSLILVTFFIFLLTLSLLMVLMFCQVPQFPLNQKVFKPL